MRLVCDIGNTRTNFALLKGNTICHRFSIQTATITSELLSEYLEEYPRPKRIAIASVVLSKAQEISAILGKLFQIKPLIIAHHHQFGIINCYHPPHSVGIDRLINVAYAYEQFHQGVIVIDFGTATTFDVVTGGASFLGGIILSGIKTMRDALGERADQLAKVPIQKPQSVIGRDTFSGIQSGLTYGSIALIKELVREISYAYPGEVFRTVITGGFSRLIEQIDPHIALFDHDLTLKGIGFIDQINH